MHKTLTVKDGIPFQKTLCDRRADIADLLGEIAVKGLEEMQIRLI